MPRKKLDLDVLSVKKGFNDFRHAFNKIYIEEKSSLRELAKIIGCSHQVLLENLNQRGYKRRSKGIQPDDWSVKKWNTNTEKMFIQNLGKHAEFINEDRLHLLNGYLKSIDHRFDWGLIQKEEIRGYVLNEIQECR